MAAGTSAGAGDGGVVSRGRAGAGRVQNCNCSFHFHSLTTPASPLLPPLTGASPEFQNASTTLSSTQPSAASCLGQTRQGGETVSHAIKFALYDFSGLPSGSWLVFTFTPCKLNSLKPRSFFLHKNRSLGPERLSSDTHA